MSDYLYWLSKLTEHALLYQLNIITNSAWNLDVLEKVWKWIVKNWCHSLVDVIWGVAVVPVTKVDVAAVVPKQKNIYQKTFLLIKRQILITAFVSHISFYVKNIIKDIFC